MAATVATVSAPISACSSLASGPGSTARASPYSIWTVSGKELCAKKGETTMPLAYR
jgi:hypothetical protein